MIECGVGGGDKPLVIRQRDAVTVGPCPTEPINQRGDPRICRSVIDQNDVLMRWQGVWQVAQQSFDMFCRVEDRDNDRGWLWFRRGIASKKRAGNRMRCPDNFANPEAASQVMGNSWVACAQKPNSVPPCPPAACQGEPYDTPWRPVRCSYIGNPNCFWYVERACAEK